MACPKRTHSNPANNLMASEKPAFIVNWGGQACQTIGSENPGDFRPLTGITRLFRDADNRVD